MEQGEGEDTTVNCNVGDSRATSLNECSEEHTVRENNKGPFSDPVYSELSRINGRINRMTKEQLVSTLGELHLETRGTKDVIKKRLKAYYKEEKLKHAKPKNKNSNCPYKYLCIVDFEATCDVGSNYPHEIIEFPAVLLDAEEMSVVAEFHEYCRPLMNAKLTEFCRSLTGITQETVDNADTFPHVLNQFMRWMKQYSLGISNSFAIVADGSHDMGEFLVMQCNYSDVPFPNFGKKWINARKLYSNFYKTQRLSISLMLENLGLSFEGRQHCGIDDARNISRIVIQMLKDGANMKINERLKWNSLPSKFADDGYYRGAVPESGDNDCLCNKRDKNESEEESTLQKNIQNKHVAKNSSAAQNNDAGAE